MKAIDLQLQFDDKLGRFMDKYTKIFLSTEVERFLNQAQDNFIQAMCDVYEYNEKARRVLFDLVKSEEVAPSIVPNIVPISDNSFMCVIPVGLMRIVEEQAVIDGHSIAIIPITHDQYLANRKNPYKQPYKDLIWRLDVDSIVELVSYDSAVITGWKVRYIIRPDILAFDDDTDLVLQDTDYSKIVDLAVELAVKSLAVGRPKAN